MGHSFEETSEEQGEEPKCSVELTYAKLAQAADGALVAHRFELPGRFDVQEVYTYWAFTHPGEELDPELLRMGGYRGALDQEAAREAAEECWKNLLKSPPIIIEDTESPEGKILAEKLTAEGMLPPKSS
jgi:hypothetical protein